MTEPRSRFAALGLMCALVAGASPLFAAPEDAAQFRAGPAHPGVYPSATSPNLMSVKWRFHTRGKVVSSPAVAGGYVYVGDEDGRLYAVRATDGSLAWKFATKGPVNSSPAVASGAVFFASLDGNVYALDAATGAERWRFKTGGERRFTAPGIHGIAPRNEIMPDPYDMFLSSPAVANGTVYIGSGDHNVYALDASSGALKWKFRTGNVVHASPAVSGGTVYVGSWDRFFYALDARSGALRWRFATGDDRVIYNQVGIASSAAVANGSVFFGCRDSFFYALDAATGKLRWKHDDHGSWIVGSPALADGAVYFTTSDEHVFYALDARSGTKRFSLPYGTFSYSSPSIAGNVAYFGVFDGRIYAVGTRSGKLLARFLTDAARRELPKHLDAKGNLDANSFYTVGTLDGVIVGLDRLMALGSVIGSPAIANSVLFVGSTDGTLYAIR